jgi:hypothetical protein
MMFPSKLREKEYIRMVAIRKDKHGNPVATKVGFVKNFEEYAAFVEKYKFTHDVYNQIATNRGDKDGKRQHRDREGFYSWTLMEKIILIYMMHPIFRR